MKTDTNVSKYNRACFMTCQIDFFFNLSSKNTYLGALGASKHQLVLISLPQLLKG